MAIKVGKFNFGKLMKAPHATKTPAQRQSNRTLQESDSFAPRIETVQLVGLGPPRVVREWAPRVMYDEE